jgi:hypothetical protein
MALRFDLIQFNSLFIYVLSSTANGQHKYKQQQYDSTGQNKQETPKTKKNVSV